MLFSLQQEHRVSSHGLRRNPAVHLGTAYKITQTCYFLMAITQHHTNQANSPWTVQTIPGIYSLGPNLLEPKSRPSRLQQIPIHYITLKQKVKQVGEKPLPLPEFVETPRNWYPHVVLAVGSNFAPCLAGSRRSDRREF